MNIKKVKQLIELIEQKYSTSAVPVQLSVKDKVKLVVTPLTPKFSPPSVSLQVEGTEH